MLPKGNIELIEKKFKNIDKIDIMDFDRTSIGKTCRKSGLAWLRLTASARKSNSALDLIIMHHLGYLSSARELFTPQQLQELLAQSRENNAAAGITGLLLYKDGSILQAIEGEEEKVRELFQKISADPRHGGIMLIFDEPVLERDFSEWSMGFRDLATSPDLVKGFNDIFNRPAEGRALAAYPAKVRSFMKSFLRGL